MYTLSIQKSFVAQHYLIGGDFGPENELHSHPYRIDLRLTGNRLNEHGYLVDIDEVKSVLSDTVAIFQDTTLNDLPEFRDLNPSLEHFARIFCEKIASALETETLEEISVRLWEDESTWAEYTQSL
ncbi:MAG: 6-carboxytetrahydropterin synthase [Candidatus Marinimicrobia bacterium]|nr:6-carboxytetrahydropterin synthase [Candidatus Neomarinimicrobiota bacterium]MCF7828798.1 6-carboxytetrahydropterin synthase [Candidatus Neomarinimicrobiota bacterium]MCF7880715.1 6-carboxytetrahydropterin synthase [Candidatus Neomarinimicrobiota bacterium]